MARSHKIHATGLPKEQGGAYYLCNPKKWGWTSSTYADCQICRKIMEKVKSDNATVAYKLVRVRKDGTIGSLFINKKLVIPVGEWLPAEDIPTKGYAHRPGWHAAHLPYAPHLTLKGRQWWKVEIRDYVGLVRPPSQGGVWWLAKWIKFVCPVQITDVRLTKGSARYGNKFRKTSDSH